MDHKEYMREWRKRNPDYQRKWRAANPDRSKLYESNRDKEKVRRRHFARTYSMSEEEAAVVLSKKSPNCNMCDLECNTFYDHDHATGLHRGWLCRKCNLALGLLDDNPELLENALRYLND